MVFIELEITRPVHLYLHYFLDIQQPSFFHERMQEYDTIKYSVLNLIFKKDTQELVWR